MNEADLTQRCKGTAADRFEEFVHECETRDGDQTPSGRNFQDEKFQLSNPPLTAFTLYLCAVQ